MSIMLSRRMKEDYTDETVIMQVVLADAEHAEEHVHNLKGSG